jgi:hypothetical protein
VREKLPMVIHLDENLESALKAQADQQGVAPEQLAVSVLRATLLPATPPEARDQWERELLGAARPWGVSFSNAAVSSEGLYD